ncbi:MAG: hypothetical protein U0Q19_05105 [Kineosporiaceae bacterium]
MVHVRRTTVRREVAEIGVVGCDATGRLVVDRALLRADDGRTTGGPAWPALTERLAWHRPRRHHPVTAGPAVAAGLLAALAALAATPAGRVDRPVPGRSGQRASVRRGWPARLRFRRGVGREGVGREGVEREGVGRDRVGWKASGRDRVLVGGGDVAVLAERVAALSRAGVAGEQVWRILADRDDDLAVIARSVVTTTGLGGSTAEGLRLAADRLVGQGRIDAGGGRALRWLAVACAVSQTSGAPLARVLDGLAEAVRAELQATRARDAALAGRGPRRRCSGGSRWPGSLGALTGVDTASVLVTTGAGRLCLVSGGALWWVGRQWAARMVRRAETAGGRT